MKRIFNFSAGPCTLPLEALQAAQSQLVEFGSTGMSLIEMSHRTKTVEAVHNGALALVKELLAVPDTHQVLFLGGGATGQFSMVPMNLLAGGKSADYTNSGAWAKKAIGDAKQYGKINVTFDDKAGNYSTLPDPAAVKATDGIAYYHLTSNETIGGIQWQQFPTLGVPLVADMSSDFMSRTIPWDKFGLVYAGAQKNIGPAGVVVVIARKDWLEASPTNIGAYLQYKPHAADNSMHNTPPVFQIWMIQLVLQWLKGKGGLAYAADMAAQRSKLLYDAIAASGGYYKSPVDQKYRSKMNAVWRLPSEVLEDKFVAEAKAAGMDGLKGHRSVGGIRASIYNAMPVEGAKALADFMGEFAKNNG
jgi:phosphoserine aminotransferase